MRDSHMLTIAFSTMVGRAHNISLAGIGPDVEILVLVQGGPLTDTAGLGRARIVPVSGAGVARSRNAAIDHAAGRYLLFCDDDVVADLPGILCAVRHLRQTGRALALGQATDPSGRMRKRYPQSVRRLTLFNSAKAATYEMLIDLAQVRARRIRFDERFGAGTELHLGDEYIFIADLLRGGLSGDAVPVIFGTHPQASSGSLWGSAEDSHARAVAINRAFGRWAFGARLAFGLKNRARLGGGRKVVSFIANGERPAVIDPRLATS